MTIFIREPELVDWLVDHQVGPFDKPLNWFSNGQRGHLHAYRACAKIQRRSEAVTHQLTVAEARATRKVCTDCYRSAGSESEEHREVKQRLEGLAAIDVSIDRVSSMHMEATGFDQIDRLLRHTWLSDMRRDLAKVNLPEPFEHLRRHVDDRLAGALHEQRFDPDRLAEEISVATALESINGSIFDRRHNPWWLDESTQAAMSVYHRTNSPMVELFGLWRPQVATLGAEAAGKEALAAMEPTLGVWLQDVRQLEGVESLSPLAGEGALDTARRAYAAHLSRALAEITSRWVGVVAANQRRREPVALIAFDRWSELERGIPANRLDLLLLKSSIVARNDGRSVSVLPRAVAEWVDAMCHDRRLSSELAELDGESTEVLDTAVALWDPNSRDVYRDFGAALAAARNL